MTIQLTKLPNGLRVITDHVPEMDSVAIGVWVDVGTRHEDLAHNGVAHMVEHMMFNGTPTRTSKQVAEEIESLGGQMNAFTSREVTAYYVHLLKDDLPKALEVLSDIIQHPIFPDNEIEKERAVIIQEIGMTNDTPDDVVFDYYQETAYPNQALGAPILGTSEIVANMTKETLFSYVHGYYTAPRLVISAAGNLNHENLCELAENLFIDLPENNSQPYSKADYQGGERREDKPLEQSHVVLGFQSFSRHHDDHYAATLLGTILGGGMSSRLFQEVREKRGLAYAVYAGHSAFNDDGQLEIYAGTGPEKLPELMPVLTDEVVKISSISVSDTELNRVKSQVKASILMSRESMFSRANRQARYLIHYDDIIDIKQIIGQIDAVTSDQIQKAAQAIFSGKPTIASIGPLEQLEEFDQTCERLAA